MRRPGEAVADRSTEAMYDPAGFYDEALDEDGSPRGQYEGLLNALARADLGQLVGAVAADLAGRGVEFGSGGRARGFRIDPVPRIVERDEWSLLAEAITQRTRALNAFVADVYGDQQIVRQGVVPRRVVESADHFEPWMLGVAVPTGHAPIVGFDVVRGADGRLRILEDNLRTPSGLAYAAAARAVTQSRVNFEEAPDLQQVDVAYDRLAAALRDAAPDGRGDPNVVLLSDGPENSAWYEHRTLADRLDIPLVTPADMRIRNGRLYALVGSRSQEVQVVYRRTDEDRLRDESGRATWLADVLLNPCRRGRISCVNSFGSGVADDKLAHAYVEEMIRFYLRQEPLLESVRTYDLADGESRKEALARVEELVVKPRTGSGGKGIVVCPHASADDRQRIARSISERPERYVAQETVMLSRHPTVVGGRLEPRHVDLRLFAIGSQDGTQAVPCGLTRVAFDAGTLVVNSSQNGGGKDTWVLR